jgi:hypothetical protein
MIAHPQWVDIAGITVGAIVAAGCTIALWRADPTTWILRELPAMPVRACRWTAASWRARRIRRAAWREGADLSPGYWRDLKTDLLEARSRRDRRRNPRREYLRRQRLRAAGFHFAGGPLGPLP